MILKFSKKWWVHALGILMIAIWLGPLTPARAEEEGQVVFEDYCSGCHTIGQGKLVGPDLAGVTERRDEGWLIRQIKEPDVLLEENDPIAIQLLQEADEVEMPNLELDDAEVTAVLAYLKSTLQLENVEVGTPSQFLPTLLIGIAIFVVLTLIALGVGRKKVEVR